MSVWRALWWSQLVPPPETDPVYLSEKGVALGCATLDAGGKVPQLQLPAIAITDTFVVASQALMLALVAETGDVAVRTDANETYILMGSNPAVLGDWQLLNPVLPAETDPVFTASAAGGISAGDITNWDNAFGWGDHSLVGYLTSVPAGYVTNPMSAVLDVNDYCIQGKDNATGDGGDICFEGGDSQDLSGRGGVVFVRGGAGDGSAPTLPAPPANAVPGDIWLVDIQNPAGYMGFAAPTDVSAGTTGDGSSTVLTLPEGDGTLGQAMVTDGGGVLSWATFLTAVPAGYVTNPMTADLDAGSYEINFSDGSLFNIEPTNASYAGFPGRIRITSQASSLQNGGAMLAFAGDTTADSKTGGTLQLGAGGATGTNGTGGDAFLYGGPGTIKGGDIYLEPGNDSTDESANGAVILYGRSTGQVAAVELRFHEGRQAVGDNFVGLKAADVLAGDTTYTLPTAFPSVNDQALVSSTAGFMSWKTFLTNPLSAALDMNGQNFKTSVAGRYHFEGTNPTTSVFIDTPDETGSNGGNGIWIEPGASGPSSAFSPSFQIQGSDGTGSNANGGAILLTPGDGGTQGGGSLYLEVGNGTAFTGLVFVRNRGVGTTAAPELALQEANANGMKWTSLKAEDDVTTTGTWTVPQTQNAVGQMLGIDLGEYTVAGLPAAATYKNCWAVATNAAGGRTSVRSDGTNWKIIAVEGATVV